MESGPEKWNRVNGSSGGGGVDNAGYEDNEKRQPDDQNEPKLSPFPMLHIPCDENDPRHDNLRNFNLSMRNDNKLGMVQYGGPVVAPKLKRNRLRRFWKLKFVGSKPNKQQQLQQRRRLATITLVLILALILFMAMLTVVLYLTVGGGLERTTEYTATRPVELTNKPVEILASRVVLGVFKLKRLQFEDGLRNSSSKSFFYLAKDIGLALDKLFKSSVLSLDYNGTDIISFRNGSIIVDCRIYLNRPYMNVAAKVGMAFIHGLVNYRGQMLLDSRFDIDVQSIMFTATRAPSTNLKDQHYFPEPGWSQWTAWSSCNNVLDFSSHPKCDPNTRQNRVRVCRQDGGHGQLMKDDEICEQQGGYPMEERLCNCKPAVDLNATSFVEKRKCVDCYDGEICLSMFNEVMATCRLPIDVNDPTGCGGHCVGLNKLCRSLGAGAYQCLDDSQCHDNEWKCNDGTCIPKSILCDGHFNCYDRSDESNCSCPNDHFQCKNNSICIHRSKVCDGTLDCFNGSDEDNCPSKNDCRLGQFACQSGMCITNRHFCDRFVDCDDGSDEPDGCNISCNKIESHVQCKNGRCVNVSALCNGSDDCGDNSDEELCDAESRLSHETNHNSKNVTENSGKFSSETQYLENSTSANTASTET